MTASYCLTKIESFRVTDRAQMRGDLLYRETWRSRPVGNHPIEKDFQVLAVRHRESQPQLEPSPDGAIEKLRMIGCCDHHDVARQLIELHQEEGNDPLYLSGFVCVATFLADGIEFVEEKDAWTRLNIVKQLPQPRVGLAEKAANQSIVANDEERESKRFGDPLCKRRLPVPRRPRQKDPVAWLVAMRAKQISANVFLHELPTVFANGKRQEEIVEPRAGFDFKNRIAPVALAGLCRAR
jgi:hypothetical protein